MGNLLTYNLSFSWDDVQTDRNILIYDLSIAFRDAQNFGDLIHRTPNLFDTDESWGRFFYFLWTDGRTYDGFRARYTWISTTAFQGLLSILTIIQSATAKGAKDVDDLNREFSAANNGWTGIRVNCPNLLVHDQNTWNEFHRIFVSQYRYRSKRVTYDYVKRFYKPIITPPESINSINNKIDRGQVPAIFKRLDDATYIDQEKTLHGEQIQMHFKDTDKSALNIDGSWKHNGFNIPNNALDLLEKWGFLLPKMYYRS